MKTGGGKTEENLEYNLKRKKKTKDRSNPFDPMKSVRKHEL